MKLHRQTVALAALGIADLAATLWLVGRCGAAEANPFMARLLAHSPWALAAVKLGALALALGILEWAWRVHPRTVRFAANAAVAAYIGIYAVGVARANDTSHLKMETPPSPISARIYARIHARQAARREAALMLTAPPAEARVSAPLMARPVVD